MSCLRRPSGIVGRPGARIIALGLVVPLGIALAARPTSASPASNIILMISDGQGFNAVTAADYYAGAPAVYESFPVKLAVSTYNVSGGYDPAAAWASFNYVKTNPTDSGAAATALAAGIKTNNSGLGVDASDRPVVNIVQYATAAGRASGVVTSVPWSHATPAGMAAHNANRFDYAGIAAEMVYDSGLDVILGAGHPWYDVNGVLTSAPSYSFVSQATWTNLVAGTPGLANPWTLIQSRAQFQALAAGPTPARVIGTAQVAQRLQQQRSGGNVQVPYSSPLIDSVPTLPEMSRAALNVLDNNAKGFFLMIEGGAVDPAEESNQKGRTIEEQLDFNHAVQAVVDWVNAPGDGPDWTNTLLIVTADHEAGHLWGPNSGDGTGGTIPFDPLTDNGPGNVPGMKFNSTHHTNSLVPLYATGAGAELLAGYATGLDPVCEAYLDNTDVFGVLRAQLPDPLAGDANYDGAVNFADYQKLEVNFGRSAGMNWSGGDFTGDGAVDFADYQKLEANFGKSAPEPGALGALLVGALAGVRRRRPAWMVRRPRR